MESIALYDKRLFKGEMSLQKKLVVFILLFLLLFTQIIGGTGIAHAENIGILDESEEIIDGSEKFIEDSEEEVIVAPEHTSPEEEEIIDSSHKNEEDEINQLERTNEPDQDVNETVITNEAEEIKNVHSSEELKHEVVELEEIDQPYIVLEDFENGLGNWTVSGARHNQVDLSISNDIVRFGNGALKLDYDFIGTQGTSGIYASSGEKIEIPGNPQKIGMWVYGDGHKHWLRQQLTDANGVNFNIDYTPGYPNGVTWEGWKYVEATLPTDWQPPYTISSQAIRYMATSDDAKTAGTLYIDQIRAVYHETDEDVTNPLLTDFKPAQEEISYTNTPEISAIAIDNEGGSGIDPERILMTMNGESVTPQYDEKTGLVSYEPTKQLAEGLHEASIEVFDHAGNHIFQTWNFQVSTGGPAFHWKGPEKVYAGSMFDLELTMDDIKSLSGTEFRINYDSQLLALVSKGDDGTNSQINISDKLKDALVESKIDEETGEVTFKWEQLDQLNLADEEVLATLTFSLGLDATGSVNIALLDGVHTYVDDAIGEVPFFVTSFHSMISQPLTMSIDGKSVNTKSEITVVDQEGNPVEGAKINVLDDRKLIKVVQPSHIYKGGSGVVGEPYQSIDEGTYIPVANLPYDGFDYYRIFMPNGEQRYYHVPKEDVEEVEWSSVFDVTDENGKVSTDLLTLSQIPIRMQASKGELVSQVMSFTILPQLGEVAPENITLTWTDDPKTTQHFTWRTNTAVAHTVVEVVVHADEKGFESQHVLRFEGNRKLFSDDLGEMIIHYAEATDLIPGTTYQYRVGDGTDAGWSDISTFTTESALEEDPFRFLFFTDTQAQDAAGFALWTDLYTSGLEMFPDAKFALHSGDIVEEGNKLQQWEDFLFASEDLFNKIPFMSVLGNHDVYGDGANTYHALFPYPKNGPAGKENFVYSFDYGNVRFIMLNSEFGVKDMEEQQEWLKQEIQSSDKLWNIAMFHRSPYKSNPKRGTDATVETFAPILEELNVDLVLTGHDHAYMRSYPMKNGELQEDGTGTIYMIGGSAGPKFYPGTKYEYVDVLYAEETQLFTSFSVHGDEIEIEAYTVDHELVDSYILKKQTQEELPEEETPTEPENPEEQENQEEEEKPIESEEPNESDENEENEQETGDLEEPLEPTNENKEQSDNGMENEDQTEQNPSLDNRDGDTSIVETEAEKSGGNGDRLPSTATPFYNWLLMGLSLIVIALFIWQVERKRRKLE